MMKTGLRQIVGRTVARVVVARASFGRRVILEFTDGTWFELYGESFSCGSGVGLPGHSPAGDIERAGRQDIEAVWTSPG